MTDLNLAQERRTEEAKNVSMGLDEFQRRDIAAIELVRRAANTSLTPEMLPGLLGETDPFEIICGLVWLSYSLATLVGRAKKLSPRGGRTGDQVLADLAEGVRGG
jgi:hypothetical protein